MQLDFEHIKKLWTNYEGGVDDPGTWLRASTQLRALVPRPLFIKLAELDATSEEFERTFHRFYDSQPEESPDDGTEDPSELALLPFAGFDNYSLDAWGRPHGMGGPGQKRGPLAAILQWKPRKGQKSRFVFGYRLYREGKRVYQSALTCAIARLNAELAPKKAQYLADKSRAAGPKTK